MLSASNGGTRPKELWRWQLYTALATAVAALLLATLLWKAWRPEHHLQDLINERFGQEVARTRHWPEECIRLRSPPASADSFLAGIKNDGMPVIIRRAHSIFGDSIKLWRNVSHLLDTHGAAVFSASYFDATDPDERFGITPVEGGRYLQKPYRTSRSLAEVVRFDREDRLLVLEQACLRCPEEDADGGGPRAAEAARNASGPNRTGADGQDDTAGLRWRMFEEWSPPPFLGDLVVRQVNLWLGRLPVGGAGRPKESPTHFSRSKSGISTSSRRSARSSWVGVGPPLRRRPSEKPSLPSEAA
ncbi:unnamed protein product [Prorocentrum cordatum]|uniref:Uncharacterized protein n=1 Tax=Prorocentrum cordatum TaxID=2364126 RepID=A0ABN9S9Y5_9DINO|nr:unnamed protein product [Polarella glacialis]